MSHVKCYMWQPCVEIDYSVAYFDRIAAFKALYRWTSIKGEAHMCFVDLLDIHASTKHVWAQPLMEVQWYGTSNTTMWSNRRLNDLRFLHGTTTCISYFMSQCFWTSAKAVDDTVHKTLELWKWSLPGAPGILPRRLMFMLLVSSTIKYQYWFSSSGILVYNVKVAKLLFSTLKYQIPTSC